MKTRALVYLALLVGCTSGGKTEPPPAPAQGKPVPSSAKAAVLLAAGDVAWCKDLAGARTTADLLAANPGTVVVLGDLAYTSAQGEFAACYDGSGWGRFKDRTRPAPGNHDYHVPNGVDYFAYFGSAAGEVGKGYYSYDLGSWHLLSLNSNCDKIGGCEEGSPQEQWVKQDLSAHKGGCILAYWHHPLFSSGMNASHAIHPEMKPIWQDLYDAHAAIVLNGHEHNFERFAPQNPEGAAEPTRGVREFVVGTGGAQFDRLKTPPQPNSEVQRFDTYGVLKLTLRDKGYDWEFLAKAGEAFHDAGSGACP